MHRSTHSRIPTPGLIGSILAVALAAPHAAAQAFTIDFDAFPVPAPFPGGIEDGFEIIASGDPLVTEVNNAGLFSNVTVGNQNPDGTSFLTVRLLSGADFEFGSITFLREGLAFDQVRVEGFNNGSSVGVDAYSVPQNVPELPMDPGYGVANNLTAVPVDEIEITIPGGTDSRTFIDRLQVLPITQNVPNARFWSVDARDGSFYDVDLGGRTVTQITAFTTEIGNIPIAGGLAALNNSVYYSNPLASDTIGLHRYDVEDGDREFVDTSLFPTATPEAFTSDPTTGRLIGIGDISDTIYITSIWEGETQETASGVLTNLGSDIGRATGAAFDVDTGTVYFTIEETPTDTVHLWSFDIDDAGTPGLAPTFIGDTGIFTQRLFTQTLGADTQVGLAFDDASDTLVMSSDEGLSARFYILDTTTAEPSFVFSTLDRLALDNLSPQHTGFTVVADSAGPGEIPVALTADLRSGQIYAATDGSILTTAQSGDLLFNNIFPGGFAPGVTDIEFGDTLDTGAPNAVYAIDDAGAMNILPIGGPSFAFPLSSQGITTGPEVGMARRGDDMYFTSGIGVPGALYRFDPNTGDAFLISNNIQPDATSLEYVASTDLFYYTSAADGRLYTYDPIADVSASVGAASFAGLNFTIDPEGRHAYIGEADLITALSLESPHVQFTFAGSLPMNNNGLQDMVFAPSSSGTGWSMFVATNGRQSPAPPQVLEFAGFAAPASRCQGDVDGDNATDLTDFTILASNFGATGLPSGAGESRGLGDLSDDGSVDLTDFTILAADFGCSELP
ncbi:MAG: hypothetical protein AAFX05_02915 [Planctomycetota bacterium]